MPELPEVESVLRYLRDGKPTLIGRSVRAVNIVWSGSISAGYGDILKAGLYGAKFAAIRRHGKYLIFSLDQPGEPGKSLYLIVHLRMTGRLYLVSHDNAVERHTRLSLMLDEGLALRFDDPRKFGRIWLVQNPGEVICGLGPDALTVAYEYFAGAFSERRRQIKPLLLDQSFVAGIGNIYADESLFRAGIHPQTSTESLQEVDVERLYRSIRDVLSEAVDAQGANIDGVFKEGGFIVTVYGRTGRACPLCGTAIAKIRVGQRGTHFCPSCQHLQIAGKLNS
ncbi:MAG: DNA-formamidopyrimidine glycosylase [Deltaproteobacteria bacterium]|nr:DNA-formamidopyrimidine glycosylase [Deltaproteobacteria bacterium]